MNDPLKTQLLVYLGELMHQNDTTFDWAENDKIKHKMNAVYTLLEIDKHERTFMEAIKEMLIK